MSSGDLTKKEIIQIARKAIEERYGEQTSGLKMYYDNGNKVWKKYYAKDYPNLIGYNYQAVQFTSTGTLAPGGGPFWVCVNKGTGEVLVTYKGM
ncbi:MAG: hypothetical protein ACFFCW_18855 [Candidatus Hodarchaeota archaeon]